MTKVPPVLNDPIESIGFVFLGRTSVGIDDTIKGYIKYFYEFWLEEPGRSILKRKKFAYSNSSPKEIAQVSFYRQKNGFNLLKKFKSIRLVEASHYFNGVEISRNSGWDKYKVYLENEDVICFGMGRE